MCSIDACEKYPCGNHTTCKISSSGTLKRTCECEPSYPYVVDESNCESMLLLYGSRNFIIILYLKLQEN